MTLLLAAAAKVTVLVLAAIVVTLALRKRSAAVRHWVLAAATLCGLSVPVLELVLPAWSLQIWSPTAATSSLTWIAEPSAADVGDTTALAVTSSAAGLADHARSGFLAAWAIGASLGFAVLIAGLFRIRQMASLSAHATGRWRAIADEVSRTHGFLRPVRLLQSPHATMLVTWGTLRPSILLPACAREWSEERMRIVLHHELAHIGRADWMVTLAAEVLRCLYWFNPLIWIACRRLRDEGECACDDLVLRSGVGGADYASHLLAVARESVEQRRLWSPAIAIARRSTLEGRVRAMLNVRLNREPLTGRGRIAALALVAMMTLTLAVVSLSSDTTVISLIPNSRRAAVGAMSAPTISRRVLPRRAAEARAPRQAADGTIEGVLYDQFGGLLPGASVSLTHTETGAQADTSTDASGAFSFSPLSPGTYELTTRLPGFATVRNVISVAAGGTVRRQLTLPLGTIEEMVGVECQVGRSLDASPSPRPQPRPRTASPAPVASVFTGGIGGQIKAPLKLTHANPVCPAGLQPTPTGVKLSGRIGIDGIITDLRDDSTDAHPALVAAAMDAVRQWEFSPTLLNGAPIETNIAITVDYLWSR
jgi:beta-lactamase regulating signal transducer with metallopeptidase domain